MSFDEGRSKHGPFTYLAALFFRIFGRLWPSALGSGAEAALPESHETLNNMIKNSPSAFSFKDRDGRYVIANPNYDRILGLPCEDLIGKTDFDIFPERVATVLRQNDLKVLESLERHIFEEALPSADGKDRVFQSHKFPVFDVKGEARYICCIALDITEQRRHEDELKRTYSLMNAIMTASDDLIFVKDLRSRFIYANQKLLHLMDTNEAELYGKTGLERLGDETEIEKMYADDRRIMNTAKGESIEERVIWPDGTKHWYLTHKAAWRDADGSVIGLIGVSREITESVIARDELKLERDKLEAIIQHVDVGIGVTNARGQIITLNPAGLRIHGFKSQEEMYSRLDQYIEDFELQRPDGTFLPLEEWPLMRAVRGEFVQNYGIRLVRRSTREFKHLSYSVVPLKNSEGMVVNHLFNITDLTRHIRAMEELERSQQRLSLATSAAEIGIWEWNLLTGAIAPTDIQRVIVDYPQGDLFADQVFARVIPEDLPEMKRALDEALEKKRDFINEFRIRKSDGSIIWVYARGRAVYDESGKPVRMYGVNIDITERKEIEARLQDAVQRANQANELKSAFLANMSHEIRTPLGAILGFTDLLRDPDLTPEEAESFHNIVRKNGEQLSNLINDILDLSKAEAGQFKTETVSIQISALLDEVCALLSVKAQEKGIDLLCQVKADLPDVIGTDPTRLRQILTNIAGNAIKFTHEGFVEMTAAKGEDDLICFTVSDTGIGITSEQAEHLFQPFSQADTSTTRKYGGTGLGLVLSKRLSHLLGGDLILKSSAPGKGSSFEIQIKNRLHELQAAGRIQAKAHAEEHEAARTAPLDKKQTLKGVKVLLVEDSPDNQQLITRILGNRGAEVEVAQDGLAGVKQASRGTHDLILMDIQMPVMDGYTATATLRERGYRKPIIALTAHAMNEVRMKTLNVGCTDHMTKPIRTEDLVQMVARYSGH